MTQLGHLTEASAVTRLPLVPPSELSPEQKELYDDIMGIVKKNFGSFIAVDGMVRSSGRSIPCCTFRRSVGLPGP